MFVPNWLLDLFAALMIAVSVYFAGRLVVACTSHRKVHVEVNVTEMVMGVAMAGMFRPSLNLLPNGPWEGVFAGFALWFIVQNVRFVSQHGFAGGDVFVRVPPRALPASRHHEFLDALHVPGRIDPSSRSARSDGDERPDGNNGGLCRPATIFCRVPLRVRGLAA